MFSFLSVKWFEWFNFFFFLSTFSFLKWAGSKSKLGKKKRRKKNWLWNVLNLYTNLSVLNLCFKCAEIVNNNFIPIFEHWWWIQTKSILFFHLVNYEMHTWTIYFKYLFMGKFKLFSLVCLLYTNINSKMLKKIYFN